MEEQQIYYVREMLYVLMRRLGLLQKERMICCGPTLVQSHIIYEISKKQGISLNDLANILGLDKSTMSRHVQSLVKEGYVKSTPGEEDRRFTSLSLTTQGEAVQQRLAAQMTGYVLDIFKRIPDHKKAQVTESIELLLKAMYEVTSCC